MNMLPPSPEAAYNIGIAGFLQAAEEVKAKTQESFPDCEAFNSIRRCLQKKTVILIFQ